MTNYREKTNEELDAILAEALEVIGAVGTEMHCRGLKVEDAPRSMEMLDSVERTAAIVNTFEGC